MTDEPSSLQAAMALTEASSNSLDELFSRDPFSYTKQDLTTIVVELRKQREAWARAEAAGKKSAPRVAKAKVQPSLGDLGL